MIAYTATLDVPGELALACAARRLARDFVAASQPAVVSPDRAS
ncbi:MAG TPA: hypothetical protein VLW50_31025 [Streptosporangiaceae bacterium]|nr:hypothetical protein [Streptosporangiaceae bacterium]